MTAAFQASLALRADGLLATFNRAGILSAADVHVGRRLGAMGAEVDESVLLALALVVRSTRHGSVMLDLAKAQVTTSLDVDDDSQAQADAAPLPWPLPQDWVARCAASPLLGGPLRMLGSQIWLGRYWDQEEQVARELLERSASRPGDLNLTTLNQGLNRLFPLPLTKTSGSRRQCAHCHGSAFSPAARGPARQPPSLACSRCCASRTRDAVSHWQRPQAKQPHGSSKPSGHPPTHSRPRTRRDSVSCPQRPCTGCSAGDQRQVPPRPDQPAAHEDRRSRRGLDGVTDDDGAAT